MEETLRNKMLHTFVIPAYGDSPYLEECIMSLKNQNVKSEILITTRQNTERIKKAAKKHGIKLIINEKSECIADDWNFAFKRACTKYVTLAHQDDIYLPGYTESNLLKAEESKDLSIIFTDYKEREEAGIQRRSFKLIVKGRLLLPITVQRKGTSSRFIKKFILRFGCPICCPTVFFNKDNLSDFIFDKKFRINPDWNAWLRLAEEDGRFLFNRGKYVEHRLHSGSKPRNIDVRRTEDRLIFRRLWFFPISFIISTLYSLSYRTYKKQYHDENLRSNALL